MIYRMRMMKIRSYSMVGYMIASLLILEYDVALQGSVKARFPCRGATPMPPTTP